MRVKMNETFPGVGDWWIGEVELELEIPHVSGGLNRLELLVRVRMKYISSPLRLEHRTLQIQEVISHYHLMVSHSQWY